MDDMKTQKGHAIYLDVCALGRPYDDQRIRRNEIETIAVVTITTLVREQKYVLYYSPVHEDEIARNSNETERTELLTFLYGYGRDSAAVVDFNTVEQRAHTLIARGMGYADAMHVANAEALKAAFITCDDALLSACRRSEVNVWCGTVVDFCRKEGLL